MTSLFFSIIAIPFLSTGRRLFALRQCLEVLRDIGESILFSLVEEAIAHDVQTLALERAWSRSRQISRARGNGLKLGKKITRVLGAISTALKSRIALLGTDTPAVDAAKRIAAAIFPEGVKPVATLPFEEKLAVTQAIIGRLTGDLAEDVAALGIEGFVKRLEALNGQFAEELKKSETQEIGFHELEAARNRGNLFVRKIIAKTMGEYSQESEEDIERRDAVLNPILEQVERSRQGRRGRRPANEIDLDNGQELPWDTEVAVTPQPVETADRLAAVP